MASETSKSGGIGFCGLLTIVFITLKLCSVIAWSWLLVLSPIWIPMVIGIGLLLIIGVCAAIAAAWS